MKSFFQFLTEQSALLGLHDLALLKLPSPEDRFQSFPAAANKISQVFQGLPGIKSLLIKKISGKPGPAKSPLTGAFTDPAAQAPHARRGGQAELGPARERAAANGEDGLLDLGPRGDGEAQGPEGGLELGPRVPGAGEVRDGDHRDGAGRLPRHEAEPDAGIRPEKVADVKARIEAGEYKPSGKDIAAGLVKQELDVWG